MSRLGSRTGQVGTLDQGTPIVFTMAGRDWQVVYRDPNNSDIITIWMTEPYTTSTYGANSGAYTNSTVRTTVNNYYTTQLGTYTAMSSFIRTPSQMSSTYKSAQAQNGSYGGAFSRGGALGGSEYFWLPSLYEACSLWGLDDNDRGYREWDDTGYSTIMYSWLRSGESSVDYNALCVDRYGRPSGAEVFSSYGVRPAAHISLKALEDALPPQYTISVNSNNSNYGTVSTSGGTYVEGTSVTLTATPATGYQLKGWSTNGGSTIISGSEGKIEYTITVSGNTTYTAVFEPIMYTVTTAVNITEAGTVSGGGSYQYGTQATLTASANNGYKFIGWDTNGDNLVDISETFNPYKFTISGNALVTAIFEKLSVTTITTNSSSYGRILYNNALISTSTQVVRDSGSTISNIYAIPNAGYAFLYWLDSATGQRYTDNPLDYTVSTDTTLTAVFGSSMTDGVAVCVESLEGSTAAIGEARITGYSNIDGVDYVHFSAIAYKGYQFLGWYIMGEETPISTLQSDDLALSQVQNKIVIARFAPIENLDDMNSQTDNGQTTDFI